MDLRCQSPEDAAATYAALEVPDILKQAEVMKERLVEAKSNILAAQAKQKQLYDETYSKTNCFPDG